MSDVQARVAEVLAAHWFRVFYPGHGPRDAGCQCGWRLPVYDNNNKARHAAHVTAVLAEADLLADHDCAACADCIHDGNRCCGCYDGVCCKESDPGSDAGSLLLRLDDAGRQVADARQGMEAATARAEKAEQYAKELERRFDSVNSHGERADLIAERAEQAGVNLAAAERRGAVAALRAAADRLDEMDEPWPDRPRLHQHHSEWLRARADRIEGED